MIDYEKQLAHLGAGMTEAEKHAAILNGLQNALRQTIDLVQRIELRLKALEEKEIVPCAALKGECHAN